MNSDRPSYRGKAPSNARAAANGHASANGHEDAQRYAALFALLENLKGIDLRHYRNPTIRRRIERRMALAKIASPGRYLEYLKNDPKEVDALYSDVLIRVTSFFRDPEVYRALCRKALTPMAKTAGDAGLRIWVPACCTGEEAYSIAILAQECLQTRTRTVPVQVFGTDLSEASLEKARLGVYPPRIAQEVSKERLERYFAKTAAGYQVNKSIRSLCTFARHDLTKDPPFSRLDLISCRNVLIYFGDSLQKRLLEYFHYGLLPTGYLLLGKSEAAAHIYPQLFAVVDKKANLYRKKPSGAAHPALGFKAANVMHARLTPKGQSSAESGQTLQADVEKLMLSKFTDPAILVDEAYDVVQAYGAWTKFLGIPSGKINLNLLHLAKGALLFELRSLVEQAMKGKPVQKTHLDAKGRTIRIEAQPVPQRFLKDRYCLIVFHEESVSAGPDRKAPRKGAGRENRQLRRQIETAEAYIRSMHDENESKTQELLSANEEILSSNEELQSLNEELETAKEELESMNEELRTVNEELEERNRLLHQSYEDLRKSDDKLRLMIESVQDYAIFMLDAEGRVATWNVGAERINGFRAAEIIGKPFSVFYTEEDRRARKPEAALRTAAEEGRFEEESWRLRKDGSKIWASVILTALYDKERRLQGYTKVTRDLSERRHAEELLRQSEERFRRLVEGVKDYAIYMMDPSGNVVTWNAGAERNKGYSSEEILGRNFSIFFTEEDRRKGKPQLLLRLAAERGVAEETGYRIRKDGSRFWANIVLTALRNKDGSLAGYTKVTRDITERVQAEERLKQAYGQLEQKVEERTRELTESNAQLRENAQRLKILAENLKSANRELEQFTYIASHDLQEPLRKIISFSHWLAERNIAGMDSTEKDYFIRMQNAANRMKGLIEDLLNYSKISEAGRRFERVDLSVVLREVLVDLETRIDQKQADVQVEPLPEIDANAFHMRQLFQNLIGNAIKFAKPGETPVVRVSGRPLGEMLEVQVRDNGIGFEDKYLDRIFLPFQRLHDRSTYEGTGIGLSICMKIVKIHKGEISASSVPGEGSTFTVRIPLRQNRTSE